MAAGILEIDLTRADAGDGLLRSLETGFVYARHGLPDALLDEAYGLLHEFFALPPESKRRCAVKGAQGETGYTGLLVEQAVGAEAADFKEMLSWGRELPAEHPLRRRFPRRYAPRALPDEEVPGLRPALDRLYDGLFELQCRFLRAIAAGLGCAETYFESMIADGPTLTRAIRYPPMAEAPAAGHVWAAAHGDINLTTALPRPTARGLQVEIEGEWVDAIAPEGCAILNTGLMLEKLTNGAIPAGVHRVIADPEQAGERLSVVQFCHPTPWTVLAPIPSCVTPDRPLREPAVAAGDWLETVLHELGLD